MNIRRSDLMLMFVGVGLAVAPSGCSKKADQAATQPPGSDVLMIIEPNLGVGKVHAGMTVQEAVAALGEPQRRLANSLEYTRQGFALMPTPDGVVQVVMCGDVTGLRGPLVKAFAGRTKEGIGMNSTREEIVRAYGEPSVSENLPGGTQSLRYESLGITFTLEAGRVYHMIVRLRGPQEPARTMLVEPLPEGKK